MKLPVFEKTHMLTPTRRERLTARPVVVLLLFLAVMIAAEFTRAIIQVVGMLFIPNSLTGSNQMLISLFATVGTVAAVLLYCLLIERRDLRSLGLGKRGAVTEYVIGLVGGLILFGAPVLLCVVTGALRLFPVARMPALWLILLFFVGFLIQGMSEELLCRSYLMISLSRKWPLWACVLANALLFSLLHLGNPDVSVIALINIFLFGLFASMLTLRRGSVWMVGALHSMWNFAQGNLFGLPVSGLRGSPSPLESESVPGTWQTLLNGGDFGPEGGLAVTLALLVGCAVLLLIPTKSAERVQPVPVSPAEPAEGTPAEELTPAEPAADGTEPEDRA